MYEYGDTVSSFIVSVVSDSVDVLGYSPPSLSNHGHDNYITEGYQTNTLILLDLNICPTGKGGCLGTYIAWEHHEQEAESAPLMTKPAREMGSGR